MTPPDIDSELERLFGVARRETEPDAGARDRIRASLATRLSTNTPTGVRRLWLGAGVGALALGGVALWLGSAAPPPIAASPIAPTPAPIAPSTAPAVVAEAARPVVPMPSVVSPVVEASPAERPAASGKPMVPDTPPAGSSKELELVRAMQQALRSGNASQVLTLASEHARRFPSGALVEEREGARAVARCRLAAPEARAAVLDAFSRRFGSSPYAARVKAACQ